MQHDLLHIVVQGNGGTCPRTSIAKYIRTRHCSWDFTDSLHAVLFNSIPKTYNSLSDRVVKHPLFFQILTRQLHRPRFFCVLQRILQYYFIHTTTPSIRSISFYTVYHHNNTHTKKQFTAVGNRQTQIHTHDIQTHTKLFYSC